MLNQYGHYLLDKFLSLFLFLFLFLFFSFLAFSHAEQKSGSIPMVATLSYVFFDSDQSL
jgi:hypothetical protein